MANKALPVYYSHPGDIVSEAPYRFQDAVAFTFMIPAEPRSLREICDTWITKPTGLEIHAAPYFPFVSIAFIYYPNVWSLNLDVKETGTIQYKEVIVSMFVKIKSKSVFSGYKMYGFMPYLFLDHPRAICTGREVFGMPKIYGDIYLPEIKGSREFAAVTPAVERFRSQYSQATHKKIIEITCPARFDYKDYLPKKTSTNISHLNEEVFASLSNAGEISYRQSEQATLSMKMDSLSFKQVRHYMHSDQVSYKSLLSYYTQNYKVKSGGMLRGKFKVNFPDDTEMFPLRKVLGLYPRVAAAFWVRSDFDLFMGEEIWNSENGRNSIF